MMTMKVLELPEELSWAVFPGRDATSICSKMPVLMCPNKTCVWRWQLISGPCSMLPDRKTAEEFLQAAIQKYAVSAPRLSAWLEENLSEGFTVFDFPLEHRKIHPDNQQPGTDQQGNSKKDESGWCFSERGFVSQIDLSTAHGDQ